jgi:hypothetical protein
MQGEIFSSMYHSYYLNAPDYERQYCKGVDTLLLLMII